MMLLVIDEKKQQKELDQQRNLLVQHTQPSADIRKRDSTIRSIQKVTYELDDEQGIKIHKLSKSICKYYEAKRTNDEYEAYDPKLLQRNNFH
jgi:hypothetical protein